MENEPDGSEAQDAAEARPLAPITCARCGFINPADGAYCSRCSMALTLPAAVEGEKTREHTDQLMSELLADPEAEHERADQGYARRCDDRSV